MKKKLALTALLFAALGLAACAENAAATAACKASKDGEECSKCCTEHHASGNTYTSGSGCTCRGGG